MYFNFLILFQEKSTTLEKDPAKLELVKFDSEFDIDPLFTKISKKFAENGGKDLFLHTIPIDYSLDIMLEGSNYKGINYNDNNSDGLKLGKGSKKFKQNEDVEVYDIIQGKQFLLIFFFN